MARNPGLEQLILVVNKLQDAFTLMGSSIELDLPQIAVVGGQSAGKSSVLENFVGRDFLPRGDGIVTRRPLVLQLIQSESEYGEFVHCQAKKFYDFNEIRKEIEAETDRTTGTNKGISNIPINLKIHSPNVLNLTLIDLPGITKVPIGDQPADIENQIRNIILQYVKNENCIILAITPGNSDLANSDALKIAQEVDPTGIRTIGVITKLDLMDEGTNARDILENKVFPLQRGYVGVVNRSQNDIDGRKDIMAALEDEKKFFLKHPAYTHLADKSGTAYLQEILNYQLTCHIRDTLPSLRDKLQKQSRLLEKDVEDYKKINADDSTYKVNILYEMIQLLQEEFDRMIEGSRAATVNTEEISHGAKINRIFHERFPFEIFKIEFDERKMRQEIAIAIHNIHGIRIGLFTPDKAFEAVVKKQISRLKEPLLKCVDLVANELYNVVHASTETMKSYSRLRDETERLICEHVRHLERTCKGQFEGYIQSEMSYMNTNHDDFIGCHNDEELPQEVRTSITSKKLKNQIIRKGWLNIHNVGLTKTRYWFVLTAENVSCFEDEKQNDMKFTLSPNGLMLRDSNHGLVRRHSFILFNVDGNTIYKDFKELELRGSSSDDVDYWKASFFRAGIFLEKTMLVKNHENKKNEDLFLPCLDPEMERQVEIIMNMVYSYMNIVTKECRNRTPKQIMFLLIDNTRHFLHTALFAHFHSGFDLDELMKESADELARRKRNVELYEACKEALRIIRDVDMRVKETTPHIPYEIKPTKTIRRLLQ